MHLVGHLATKYFLIALHLQYLEQLSRQPRPILSEVVRVCEALGMHVCQSIRAETANPEEDLGTGA